MGEPAIYDGELAGLVERARRLAGSKRRSILGICGAPGAGKSSLAAALLAALGGGAALVPMDGFHLANSELVRLGRRDRKGAIDTFDGAGYVALIRRLRAADEPVVYAPEFRREIEEPIAGAIAIPRDMPLVITEGNYLLVDADPWNALAGLLDQTWYLDPPEDVRQERLIARHIAFGKPRDVARSWSLGPDQQNAELIAATRPAADLIITNIDL
ncbi:MAG: nucleoside/nucleotide kinase family protein [Alphaproteobacteria bacterium]|nr:nucleoside/nucleotide kinase family protein [Alphaproteobacteria bacterium]